MEPRAPTGAQSRQISKRQGKAAAGGRKADTRKRAADKQGGGGGPDT